MVERLQFPGSGFTLVFAHSFVKMGRVSKKEVLIALLAKILADSCRTDHRIVEIEGCLTGYGPTLDVIGIIADTPVSRLVWRQHGSDITFFKDFLVILPNNHLTGIGFGFFVVNFKVSPDTDGYRDEVGLKDVLSSVCGRIVVGIIFDHEDPTQATRDYSGLKLDDGLRPGIVFRLELEQVPPTAVVVGIVVRIFFTIIGGIEKDKDAVISGIWEISTAEVHGLSVQRINRTAFFLIGI